MKNGVCAVAVNRHVPAIWATVVICSVSVGRQNVNVKPDSYVAFLANVLLKIDALRIHHRERPVIYNVHSVGDAFYNGKRLVSKQDVRWWQVVNQIFEAVLIKMIKIDLASKDEL